MNKDIIEGNKLIAEFMGKKIQNDWVILGGKYNSQYHVSVLKYNSDWNKLMPVAWKIGAINELSAYPKKYHMANLSPFYHEITMFWEAIAEFIKWYNQQNK